MMSHRHCNTLQALMAMKLLLLFCLKSQYFAKVKIKFNFSGVLDYLDASFTGDYSYKKGPVQVQE